MQTPSATIAIVVDTDFGDRLLRLATQMPVWIVDTSANHSWAESIWSNDASNTSNLTTFRVTGGEPSDWVVMILPQVELHHGQHSQSPPYRALEIFGTEADDGLRRVFSGYGFTISDERIDGFRALR